MAIYPNNSAKAFFTPAADIHKEDPDRDKYSLPYAKDTTPPPPDSCPYVADKPYIASSLRVCKQGCTCTHYTAGQFGDCPLYQNQNRLDTVIQK